MISGTWESDGMLAVSVSDETGAGGVVVLFFVCMDRRPNDLFIHDNTAPGDPLLGEVLGGASSIGVSRRNEGKLRGDADGCRLLSGLVVDFDGEAEIADHAPYFRGRSARCGEVSVDEDGVRRIEGQRL